MFKWISKLFTKSNNATKCDKVKTCYECGKKLGDDWCSYNGDEGFDENKLSCRDCFVWNLDGSPIPEEWL